MSLRLYEFLSINKYYILIFLIPISLATGPAAPDILISLSSLIFVYEYHKTIFTKKFLSEKLVLVFLSFWIYIILNSLFNDIAYIGKSIVFIRFFFLIFIFQLCLTDINKNRLLIRYWVYFLIFVILITFLQRIDGNYENIFGIRGNYRLTLLLHDKLAIGNYLIKIFPFMIVYFFIYEKKYYFSSILFLIFIFTVLLSGERAASNISMIYLIMLMGLVKLRFAISFLLVIIFLVYLAAFIDLSLFRESY